MLLTFFVCWTIQTLRLTSTTIYVSVHEFVDVFEIGFGSPLNLSVETCRKKTADALVFVLVLNDLPWAEPGFDLLLSFTIICLSEVAKTTPKTNMEKTNCEIQSFRIPGFIYSV